MTKRKAKTNPKPAPKKRRAEGRRKGADGERELALRLRELGIEAERTAQHCGNVQAGEADLRADIPGGWHVECKRVAQIGAARFMAQAERDVQQRGSAARPVVMMRQDRGDWLAMARLADFVELVRRAECASGSTGGQSRPPGDSAGGLSGPEAVQ